MSQTPDTLSPIDSADTSQGSAILSGERADLLEALRKHRAFLRFAVKELTDEQARTRTTVSELTLGGLVKHVAQVEAQWTTFMVEGAGSAPEIDWESIDWANPPAEVAAFADSHRLLDGETLDGALARYEEVARHTDDLVATLDLDTVHELPTAPWFEPGATWSVRRAVLHILAESSQHAGHADIIRESLDGQKTMG
ncbi:DinB family protein [Pedococcus bigeumensis]|uniref:DinB family protein n=1 Tax=Pedococcus bigeumensis TaxID=433644 RepID=A0A502D0E1_9MICO|nr:DinB family protein [Pedococcus bigeumensis]TPG18230.1 DinB family protein [Pedococcus bigeumensis]